MATATLAISIASSLGSAVMGVIAQHSLRLKDAKAENQAVPQALQAMQQDFTEIAGALSNGQITPNEAVQLLDQSETAILKFLQSLVGKPGTAWSGQPSGCPGSDVPKTENGSHPCNKSCTVGCCIYYNYIEPAFDCFMKRLQKGGTQGVHVPAIAGNTYGFPSTPAYTISWTPKTPVLSFASGSSSITQAAHSVANALGLGRSSGNNVVSNGAYNQQSQSKLLTYLLLGGLLLFAIFTVSEK